jgi:hypothetical protein
MRSDVVSGQLVKGFALCLLADEEDDGQGADHRGDGEKNEGVKAALFRTYEKAGNDGAIMAPSLPKAWPQATARVAEFRWVTLPPLRGSPR